jgi:uncharacterized protein YbjT (DUF2867 family)
MHITVVPASPKTGQATIRSLLADARNPTVRGVYRDLAKVPAEFKSHPRFEAVQGSVEEASSLDLSGSDAVLNITPPLYVEERDIVAHARLVSENVKAAVQKAASVKRLVLLSSVGAQYDHGTVGLFPGLQAGSGSLVGAGERRAHYPNLLGRDPDEPRGRGGPQGCRARGRLRPVQLLHGELGPGG